MRVPGIPAGKLLLFKLALANPAATPEASSLPPFRANPQERVIFLTALPHHCGTGLTCFFSFLQQPTSRVPVGPRYPLA